MKWSEEIPNAECVVCGNICKEKKDGREHLCETHKMELDGLVILICFACGNTKIIRAMEPIKKQLEWLKEKGFMVEKVDNTWLVGYPMCPQCCELSKECQPVGKHRSSWDC